ncbi:MAG TPA: caspase family protein [Pyrinomonadaceae bacterium]
MRSQPRASARLFIACLLALALSPARAPRAQDRGLTAGGASAPQVAARFYALVIGNNNYASLPKLKTAGADARAVEKLLREEYGFQTKLLVDATRTQIVSALSAYRRELSPDASLLVYYAGHGYNDRETDKAYWLPVDAERDDQANWLIADEITTGIKAIPAKHVLVVADSCYSGTLTRGLGDMQPRPAERAQFLQRMAAGKSRTLIASGGNEPVADGGGGSHSVFAAALLKGLREIGRGQFTAGELYNNYVLEAVAGRAQQTPVYALLQNSGHESGDFVFVRVKVGDKTVEVTVNTPPAASADPAAVELSIWNAIQGSTDPEDFKDYLAKYPSGRFVSFARRRLAALTSAAPAGNAARPPEANAGGSPAAAAKYPGTNDGAQALLAEFVKPGADLVTLSKALRPTRADYEAVFTPELAARAETVYGPAWDSGQMIVAPKQGQTQVLVFSATSEEVRSWTGVAAAQFPGGWKNVGAQLKPGVRFYRFKFVVPGEGLGMAYDGLTFVNGHWRIFPKPWRLLTGN